MRAKNIFHKIINPIIYLLQNIILFLSALFFVGIFIAKVLYSLVQTEELLPQDRLPPSRSFKKLPAFDNKKHIANIIKNFSLHDIQRRVAIFSGRNFKWALPRARNLLLALNFHEENSYREGLIEQLSIKSEWIPKEFICPLSRSIINGIPMKHPALPFNYDFLYLLMWVKHNDTDPIMRARTRIIDYTPNYPLKLKLDAYIFFMKDTICLLKRINPSIATPIVKEAHTHAYLKNGFFFRQIIRKDLNDVLVDERKLVFLKENM